MAHIMLDLETLDTSSTAVVTAIGAVFFDPHSSFTGSRFYRVTNDWSEQQKHGCTVSGDTVHWWLTQSKEAQSHLVYPDPGSSCSTEQALRDFIDFLDGFGGDVEVWGNGADFDNIILGNLYKAYGIQRPWTYSKNRCFRTMNSLSKGKQYVAPARQGTHHNALDDALTQATILQAIFAYRREYA